MPASSTIRSEGRRIAISAGENEITIDGVDTEENVLYLYEMSYAQRFSSGSQIDIPAYTTPAPPGSRGDINGDGAVDIADVSALLDAVTAGETPAPEVADLTGDGQVAIGDVIALLSLVTSAG